MAEARPAAATPMPGVDFLKSLREVFNEVEARGFTSKNSFQHVTGRILQLLDRLKTTTAAKARASWSVHLPDGSEVKSYVALPPRILNIDTSTTNRLREVDSSKEFTGILLSVMHAQRGSKKLKAKPKWNSPTRSKKVAKKCSPVSSPEQSPSKRFRKSRMAALMKIELQREVDTLQAVGKTGESNAHPVPELQQGSTEVTQTDVCEGRPAHGELASPAVDGANTAGTATNCRPLSNISRPCTPMEEFHDAEEEISLAHPQTTAHLEDSSTTYSLPTLKPQSTASQPPVTKVQFTQDDTHLDMSSDLQIPSSSQSYRENNEEPRMDIDANKNSIAVDRSKGLAEDLKKAIKILSITNDTHWKDKSILLKHLGIKHKQVTQLAERSPADRLDNILQHTQEFIESINTDNWLEYRRHLYSFSGEIVTHEYDYEQRLMKLIDILYLPEELEVIATEKWDNLVKVAEFCSVLAEVLGPDDEEIDEDTKNRWIAGKRRDVAFWRKLMGAKERIGDLRLCGGEA